MERVAAIDQGSTSKLYAKGAPIDQVDATQQVTSTPATAYSTPATAYSTPATAYSTPPRPKEKSNF
jgi:hypothetical protein